VKTDHHLSKLWKNKNRSFLWNIVYSKIQHERAWTTVVRIRRRTTTYPCSRHLQYRTLYVYATLQRTGSHMYSHCHIQLSLATPGCVGWGREQKFGGIEVPPPSYHSLRRHQWQLRYTFYEVRNSYKLQWTPERTGRHPSFQDGRL